MPQSIVRPVARFVAWFIALPAAGILGAACYRWWTSPLGPPLQIAARAAGMAKASPLPEPYTAFWVPIFASCLAIGAGVLVCLAVIAVFTILTYKEMRGCQIYRRSGIRSSGGS